MVTADLLSRARAGDGEAFRELAESHRRELQARPVYHRKRDSIEAHLTIVQRAAFAAPTPQHRVVPGS